MYTNRIKELLDDEAPLGDYWVVQGPMWWARVSPATAAAIERRITRLIRPRWIVFTDLAGSRIRVRAEMVRGLCECTAEQRATDRRLDRAQRREEKADRKPWEDDD
ncbi:MAG TPA: hypothetical protein VFZ11_14470 [Gemmatimonadaceae bacterium]